MPCKQKNQWYAVYVGDQKKIKYIIRIVKNFYRLAQFWSPQKPNITQKNKRYPAQHPLLPGYLFVKITPDKAILVQERLLEGQIGAFLSETGSSALKVFTEKEISTLRDIEEAEKTPTPINQPDVNIGEIYDITNGSFIHTAGTVVEVKDTSAILSVTLWGRTVCGELPKARLFHA